MAKLECMLDEMRYLYQKGYSTCETAKNYGFSQKGVHSLLKETGIKMRSIKESSNTKKDKIGEWDLRMFYIEQEKTLKEMGRMYGKSIRTISIWLSKYQIPTRGARKRIVPSKKTFEKLYLEEELDLDEVAEYLGISRSIAYQRMMEYKIPMRDCVRKSKILPEKELTNEYGKPKATIFTVANIFKVSPGVVSKNLHRYGVQLHKAGLREKISAEELEKLFIHKGMHAYEIAIRHELTLSYVFNKLLRSGLLKKKKELTKVTC